MKEKILNELRAKYKNRFSVKFLEGIADAISGKVTKDDEIDDAIKALEDGVVTIFDIEKEVDRRTTDLGNHIKILKDELESVKDKKEDPPVDKDKDKDKAPDSDLVKLMETLVKKVENLEKNKEVENKRSTILSTLKEKEIPAFLLDSIDISTLDVDKAVELVEQVHNKSKEHYAQSSGSEYRPHISDKNNKSLEEEVKRLSSKF